MANIINHSMCLKIYTFFTALVLSNELAIGAFWQHLNLSHLRFVSEAIS